MYLAGEATHETLWGTIDGAWESGERAAEAALRRIGALKDPEPARRGRRSHGGARREPRSTDATPESADLLVERQGLAPSRCMKCGARANSMSSAR